MPTHTFHFDYQEMNAPDNGEPSLGRTDSLSRFALSGANALPVPGPLVYNPGVKGTAVAVEAFFAGLEGEAAAFDFAQQVAPDVLRSDIKLITDGDLCSLGDALVTLVSNLALRPSDVALFPLRAGHRIREILQGMMPVHPPFVSVEFSEAASKPNDAFYRERIVQGIRPHNSGNAQFKLSVVDVGDSGKGTEKMLQLLYQIHEAVAPLQQWIVEFHVFHVHSQPRNFTKHEGIYGNVVAIVEPYRAYAGTKVLDDWVAAMGLGKVLRKIPGGEVYVPATMEEIRPAAIIIKSPAGYRTLVSKVGKHVGNLAISRYSTQAMDSSPRLKRKPKFDLWNR